MRISFALLFFTAISPADFTKLNSKVQLHLHVEYINRNEACVTCWPKNESGERNYYLYNQTNTDVPIEDRGPCKSLSSRYKTAHLGVQQEVTVVCGQHGNLNGNSINVTLFPLNNSISDITGNNPDSDTLLKCHSKSCLKLSLIHVSNEDAYCTASSNSFGIISFFSPSPYSDQKIESKESITTLLEALEVGHNFDEWGNSCVKVTGTQYLDITPSATPEAACPQPTSCAAQAPCVQPVTDALNRIIQDKPTYVLVSFIILMVMFALLVLAIVIIPICLAKRFCKKKRCGSNSLEEESQIVLDGRPPSTMNPTTVEMSTAFGENNTSSTGEEPMTKFS